MILRLRLTITIVIENNHLEPLGALPRAVLGCLVAEVFMNDTSLALNEGILAPMSTLCLILQRAVYIWYSLGNLEGSKITMSPL